MTYTRMWSDDTPLGSRDADEIDDCIREFKIDLHERMTDLLGADGDWGADDPIIPYSMTDLKALADATGSVTNVERVLPWFASFVFGTAGTQSPNQQYYEITGANATVSFLVPLVLPVGVTITTCRARVQYHDTGHAITGILKSTADNSDIFTSSFDAPVDSATPQWIAPHTAPALLTISTDQYGVLVTLANNNVNTSTPLRFYGLQIKFTHPGGTVR